MGTHPIFESDFDCLTDQFGEEGLNGQSSGSGGGGTSNFSTGNIDPHEIFNMMFGNNDFGFGGMPSGFSTSFSSSNSGSPGSFSHSSSFDNGTHLVLALVDSIMDSDHREE